jgi:hypothetical protein
MGNLGRSVALGRWIAFRRCVAQLVSRLLATEALWVRIHIGYHSKTTNGRPKQRSGQHTKKQYRVVPRCQESLNGRFITNPVPTRPKIFGSDRIRIHNSTCHEKKEKTPNTAQVFGYKNKRYRSYNGKVNCVQYKILRHFFFI